MTQQEFTERTGYTPATAEEFEAIHEMYVNAVDMDKDTFCKEWLKCKDNELFRTYYVKSKHQAMNMMMLHEKCAAAAHSLIDRSVYKMNEDTYMEAIDLIGRREVIRYKLDQGYELSQKERDYIISML